MPVQSLEMCNSEQRGRLLSLEQAYSVSTVFNRRISAKQRRTYLKILLLLLKQLYNIRPRQTGK